MQSSSGQSTTSLDDKIFGQLGSKRKSFENNELSIFKKASMDLSVQHR
jgi:hypothetical protein